MNNMSNTTRGVTEDVNNMSNTTRGTIGGTPQANKGNNIEIAVEVIASPPKIILEEHVGTTTGYSLIYRTISSATISLSHFSI